MVPVSVGLVLLPINGKNLSERNIPGVCVYEAGQCQNRQRECASTAGCAVLYRPYSWEEIWSGHECCGCWNEVELERSGRKRNDRYRIARLVVGTGPLPAVVYGHSPTFAGLSGEP